MLPTLGNDLVEQFLKVSILLGFIGYLSAHGRRDEQLSKLLVVSVYEKCAARKSTLVKATNEENRRWNRLKIRGALQRLRVSLLHISNKRILLPLARRRKVRNINFYYYHELHIVCCCHGCFLAHSRSCLWHISPPPLQPMHHPTVKFYWIF